MALLMYYVVLYLGPCIAWSLILQTVDYFRIFTSADTDLFMRPFLSLIAITGFFVFSSEALVIATAPSQLNDFEAALATAPSHRLLRSRQVTTNAVDSEERGLLTNAEMQDMMKNNVSPQGYAEQLKVDGKMKELTSTGGTGLYAFMNTEEYLKHHQYLDFVRDETRKLERQKRLAMYKKSKSTTIFSIKWLAKKWISLSKKK
ncbi:unnamed protein product [Phytophthora fragariaefolia]|uniref:Unnamed protein product n=1 Tax=Phytophthora fragariaefolia TaxID=1490495 RepID=A0A9W6X2C7_9STRA|nr:unnamed protein product [Phytophthora fragariaefolia]